MVARAHIISFFVAKKFYACNINNTGVARFVDERLLIWLHTEKGCLLHKNSNRSTAPFTKLVILMYDI